MPVDYINIIDRVWGHLKLGSGEQNAQQRTDTSCVWIGALQRALEKMRMEEMYGHNQGKYKNRFSG